MGFYDELKKPTPHTPEEQQLIARAVMGAIQTSCLLMQRLGKNRLMENYCWRRTSYATLGRFTVIGSGHSDLFRKSVNECRASAAEVDGILFYLNKLLAEEGFPPGCVRRESWGNDNWYVICADISW